MSRGRRITKKYKFKETKDITPTRDKVSSEWRLFSKNNFVTFQIYFSFFMLSKSRPVSKKEEGGGGGVCDGCTRTPSPSTTKASPPAQRLDLRRVASVHWESLCSCKLQFVNRSIIWVSSDKHSTNSVLLVVLIWSGARSCSKVLQKRLVLPSARETGRESALDQRVKTHGNGWLTSTKTQVLRALVSGNRCHWIPFYRESHLNRCALIHKRLKGNTPNYKCEQTSGYKF